MTALAMGKRNENLPAEVTRFVGRRRELAAIIAAIDQHRLVTLRGVGGVGKTRLALQAAREVSEAYADGCWLVELSALHSPELLPSAVSTALGLPDEGAGDPLGALAAQLAELELLLVLDTCEHLVEACAGLAQTLLAAAPGLRILATSREPLGVPDEHALLIAPLELPAEVAEPGPAAGVAVPGSSAGLSARRAVTAAHGPGERADAVVLFVDRARAAVPEFALTPANTAAVCTLCRRLDGIPLALELAAVRLRGMEVDEILDRLSDRFRILGTARTATGRHRTLRAAVSWSYDLCTPAEQRLWAELSVFPGGFGLEAAERICGPGAFDALIRLVEKSVVQYTDDTRRYHLLDTMREFGAERLAEAGAGAVRRLRSRHRDYYLELAEAAAAGSLTAAQTDWLSRLGAETDNLRVALAYSFAAEEPGPGQASAAQPEAGLRMTTVLRPYWLMVGQFAEGRRWHELAAGVRPGSPENAWALFGAGVLAVQQGDLDVGRPLLERAAAAAAEHGDDALGAYVSDARAMAAFNSGDLGPAEAGYQAALAVYARIGFGDPLALVTYSRLASVCLLLGEIDRAVALCEECLSRCAEVGEQWARGTALWVRGAARWLSGDSPAAIEDVLVCLRLKEPVNDLHTIAMSFDLLSICRVALSEFELAAVLYGAGDTLWTLLAAPVLMGPAYAEIRRGAADAARAELGGERFSELLRRGQALALDQALAVAKGDAATVAAILGGPGSPDGADVDPDAKPLTRREKEIAVLVADGLGNREIAEQLFLSRRTVESHVEHIFTKLRLSSRTQLAGWVLERKAAL